MSENIDLRIHGHELTIKDNKWGGSSREMQSRASGEKLKWKDNKALKGGDVKCTDAGGQVVARVEIVTWKKVGKEGRVELGAGVAAGGALMDEIVVGGIAMAEFLSRRQADDAEVSSAVVQICTAIISS